MTSPLAAFKLIPDGAPVLVIELAGRLAEPPQVWFLHDPSGVDPIKGHL